jgi:O-antigen ligase
MLLTTSERARFAVEERVAFGVTASFSDPRWDLMSASVLLWLEHPWFGSGWGSWAARFELVKPTHLSHLLPEHAHNDLIELLVENGVLGTLPLVALAMITLQVRGFKTPRSPDGRWLIVGLSAVCLASLLDFPFHIPAISLWWACAAGSLRYTELDQKA